MVTRTSAYCPKREQLLRSTVWPVILLVPVLMGLAGCGSSPPTWHLKGPLWEASQEREFQPFSVVRDSRRVVAPQQDLPLAPNASAAKSGLIDATGSLSVGAVNRGFLVHGRSLPAQGRYHRATSDQLKRGTWQGTDEMILLILGAAEALAEVRPGSRLEIANIARRGGGRIPWSVSHQTGRDADILFPLLRDGEPYLPGAMIHLDEMGSGVSKSGDRVQLDVPGLTAVVRAIVEQQEVGVRHLFIARGLRQMVLDYAEMADMPIAVQRRMSQLLKQPRGSLPHNDHLHIRIRCAPGDILNGCSNMGGGKAEEARREPRVRELLKALSTQRPLERAATLGLLAIVAPRDKRVRAQFMAGLDASNSHVRAACLEGLMGTAGTDLDRALAKRVRGRSIGGDMAHILGVVEKRTDRLWTRTLRAILKSPAQKLPSIVGGERNTVGEALWLAGVTADHHLLSRVFEFRAQPEYAFEATRAAARILLPPPTESAPEQLDILREEFSRLKLAEQREQVQEHMKAWGLLDLEGRVDRRACYKALLDPEDAPFHAARRLLDMGHPKACRCPRWSREDLRYYWRRRL